MRPNLPDVPELAKAPDDGVYRDVYWSLCDSPDASPSSAFVLARHSDVKEVVLQLLGSSTSRTGRPVGLGTWNSLTRRQTTNEQWRDQPLPTSIAQDMGEALFRALPQDFQSDLQHNVVSGLPPHDTRPMRIRIAAESRWMAELPWEMMWSPGGLGFLAHRGSPTTVREVPAHYVRPPEKIPGRLRLLVVPTNPKDERVLDLWREENALVGSLDSGHYEIRTCQEPTLEGLSAHLRDWMPHIVHYVGHSGKSNSEGFLILHDNDDGTRWIDASTLSSILPSCTRLLCLSTCFTQPNYDIRGLARFANAKASIPTAVANLFAMTEGGVRSFWSKFYEALVTTQSVVKAVDRGRAAAQENDPNVADWASVVAHIREGVTCPFRPSQEARGMSQGPEAPTDISLDSAYLLKLANQIAGLSGSLGERASQNALDHSAVIARHAADLEKGGGRGD